MVCTPERVSASIACEGEVRHVPEGGGGSFVKYPEGGNASVYREIETTKSGYLTFDPGVMFTIKRRQQGFHVSEYSISYRGNPSSDPIQKTTGSSKIPTPKET